MDQRRKIRTILSASECVVPASVFDPISARIAQDLGFETGMVAGSIASLSVLGAPDIAVLTLTELAELIRRIARASSLPVIVDADHGYGNALSVMRTVQELENAGAAALTIEDTLLPHQFAGSETALVSLEEGLGKVRAALAARKDPELVIVARTSAMAVTDINDAVRRARAYSEAGADALFLAGVSAMSQIEAIRNAVNLPIVLGSTKASIGSSDALAANGVRIALGGHQAFYIALQAIFSTMKALREQPGRKDLPQAASAELIAQVTRSAQYKVATKEFLADE